MFLSPFLNRLYPELPADAVISISIMELRPLLTANILIQMAWGEELFFERVYISVSIAFRPVALVLIVFSHSIAIM